jgi:hypothetical protein
MATGDVPINDGQLASAEDQPGQFRHVTNFLTDLQGFNRVRPGITNATFDPTNNAQTSGSPIIGMYVWTNPVDRYAYLVYVRADRYIVAKNLTTLVKTVLSTSDVTTQLDGNAAHPTFAEDSVRLLIAGGGQIQTWDGAAALSSRLATYTVGVNQPPLGATHIAKLANYIVANNVYPGSLNQFFWSALGDGNDTSWPPLNFNTADARPDPVVGVYENLRELYVFGTQTLQVYGITSDANLPFQASAALDLGTIAPYSPIRLDQTFAFLDYRRRFVQSDGRSFTPLSAAIDKELQDLSAVADCWGFRCRIGFWDLLIWVFPTASMAYYYELNQQKWGRVRGWNGTDAFALIRMGAYAYYAQGNQHFIGDNLHENVFTFDLNARNDVAADGTLTLPIVAERTTGRLDWETTKRKRCNSVRLFLRRGTTASAAVEIMKSDDGGPWSSPFLVGLGSSDGDTTSWADWYPGGIYRRRQYRIRYSNPTDTVISAIEEDYSVLAG